MNAHEKEQCNCGQYGCLEQYASATGVVRVAKRTLEKTSEDTALRNHADLTAKDVFDEAKAGDKVALEVVDEVCGILGAALSNIACVVNPEIIVIGGGVSKAGGILTDAVKKHFVATSFHACANTKFVLAGTRKRCRNVWLRRDALRLKCTVARVHCTINGIRFIIRILENMKFQNATGGGNSLKQNPRISSVPRRTSNSVSFHV